LESGEPLDWIESKMAEEGSIRKNDNGGALGQAKGFWQQFQQYAYEVRTETKRVTWPGKQEIYGTTVMVILTTFLFGIYFAICDRTFGYLVRNLLNYLRHH
jgi:preprotein translocase subunit SecE